MPATYHFQNPADGHPMILRAGRNGRPVVEAADCSDTESCTALECRAILDARELTLELPNDLHVAADHLRRRYDADVL